MGTLINDLRYAFRQLHRNLGFAATAIMTLALGISVSTAMFTVLDAVLLRPLPYPNASQLVAIAEQDPSDRTVGGGISALPNVRDWQQGTKTLESLAYYRFSFRSGAVDGSSEFIPDYIAGPTFFETLGVKPLLGRAFDAHDRPEDSVVVLGYNTWQSAFHGAHDVVGRSLKLGDHAFTVIGVMPPSFTFPNSSDDSGVVWSLADHDKSAEARDSRMFNVIGRMRPGVTAQQVATELSTIQSGIAAADHTVSSNRVSVEDYRSSITKGVAPALYGLFGAVLAIWLIACVNVASLMLTRATARRREIAVRAAIGAAGGRLARQFLTESLLLSAIATVMGTGLAYGFVRLLDRYIREYIPFAAGLNHPDLRLIGVLVALTIISGILFGIAPAIQASLTPIEEALRDGGRSAGSSKKQRRVLSGFVCAEIAMSLVLLITAGLLLRSVYALRHTPLGFSSDHVLTATLMLPQDRYRGQDVPRIFDDPLLERVQHLPGVRSAAISTSLPLNSNFSSSGSFEIIGRAKDPKHPMNATVHAVSPSYFATLGIPVLRGRSFTESDGPGTPLGVVVNQEFVKKYFPNEDPIGKQLKISDDAKDPRGVATIIGISGDTHQRTLADAIDAEMNFDYAQLQPSDEFEPFIVAMFQQLAVRTTQAPEDSAAALRRTLLEIDPNLTVLDVGSLDAKVESTFGTADFAARLLWIFAGGALFISLTGIYGTLAYNVAQQTREHGVRIALGATRERLLWGVLRQSLGVVGVGVVAGIALALASARFLRSFLYGVTGQDAATLAAAALLLVACAALASFIPARRAANVDPMTALRYE